MQNIIKNSFVAFALLIFSQSDAFAQRGEEVGGYIGTSFYYGDLNTTPRIQKPRLALGVFAKKNFNTRLSLRGGLGYARISASDASSLSNFERGRNLSFRTDIVDFTGGVEFNFLEHEHGSSDNWYSPYLFAGFSVFYFNPTAELNGERFSLRGLGTEGQAEGDEYFVISSALTLGAGLKWDISKDLSIQTELTVRQLFTDYVDDVSTVYPDFATLGATRGPEAVALSDRSIIDGIGVTGRQRGNSRSNDMYMVLSVGITRYFGHIQCPAISDFK